MMLHFWWFKPWLFTKYNIFLKVPWFLGKKIYQILYPFLGNLTIHIAIWFRAGGTGGASAGPGGHLLAIQFLVDIKVAFLLQMNFYYYWALLAPSNFWTVRRSCGLHAGSVCLIFLTHLFVCISKTMFFYIKIPCFTNMKKKHYLHFYLK